jgi:DNA processing protein
MNDVELPPEAFAAALAGLPGMNPTRLLTLLRDRPPALAWASAGKHASVSVVDVWAAHQAAGVDVHILGSAAYPPSLAADHEAPAVLFAQGDLAALDHPRVAMVGTRRCTHYGRDVARQLGRQLAEAGVTVVSGLALGVDGASHLGALEIEGAPPVAVVGSGHDVIYPRAHARLQRQVVTRGVVLSEWPLGTRPDGWRFPSRNRILAALADVVVVVESHMAGGSRHTVEAANDRGRRILAVPGPITSPASGGTNQLLLEGCGPVTEVDDVLVALGLDVTVAPTLDFRRRPEGDEAVVLAAVTWTPTNLDQIIARTGLRPGRVAVALAHLEEAGWLLASGGWWERQAPSRP